MAHAGDEDNHRSSSADLAPSLRTLLNNSPRKSDNRRAIARRYHCLKWIGLSCSAIYVVRLDFLKYQLLLKNYKNTVHLKHFALIYLFQIHNSGSSSIRKVTKMQSSGE